MVFNVGIEVIIRVLPVCKRNISFYIFFCCLSFAFFLSIFTSHAYHSFDFLSFSSHVFLFSRFPDLWNFHASFISYFLAPRCCKNVNVAVDLFGLSYDPLSFSSSLYDWIVTLINSKPAVSTDTSLQNSSRVTCHLNLSNEILFLRLFLTHRLFFILFFSVRVSVWVRVHELTRGTIVLEPRDFSNAAPDERHFSNCCSLQITRFSFPFLISYSSFTPNDFWHLGCMQSGRQICWRNNAQSTSSQFRISRPFSLVSVVTPTIELFLYKNGSYHLYRSEKNLK